MASAPTALKFCIDIEGRKRVEGLKTMQEVPLPALVQSDVVTLNVFLLKTISRTRTPFFGIIPVSGIGLSVSIGDLDGTYGVMAYQDTWTTKTTPDDDGDSNYFIGNLSLDYEAINTRFTAEQISSFVAHFKIDMSVGGNWTTVYQQPVTIHKAARTHTGGEVLPAEAVTYLSKLEAGNTYAKRFMGPGETIILTSADGTKHVELSCSDDGSLSTNEI